MHALVCREYGPIDRLVHEDIPEPEVGPGCVLIRVRAASVNPPDVLMPQGKYQVKPPTPFVPGVEAMGTVIDTGPGVTGFAPGDRVMTYAGQGCFAEQVAVPANRVRHVPEGMDDLAAAGFVLVYSTAYHGLVDCGQLAAGETIVILGASGGIGLCAIQIAKAIGATVVAAASTPLKQRTCLNNGADHVIDSDPGTLGTRIKELTGGRGADVILDVVGGDATESALRAIAPYGRFLIAGYASGVIPLIKGNLVLLKQARVIGVSYRLHLERNPRLAMASLDRLCELWGEGRLRTEVTQQFSFARIVDALQQIADRRVIGKAVVTM